MIIACKQQYNVIGKRLNNILVMNTQYLKYVTKAETISVYFFCHYSFQIIDGLPDMQ